MTEELPTISWRTPTPDALAAALARRAATTAPPGSGAVTTLLEVVAGESDALALPGDVDSQAVARDHNALPPFHARARIAVAAVGWATVELERWGRVDLLPPDLVLGARVGRLPLATASAVPDSAAPSALVAWPVVLLEPATEGRLAASLARHGEGWTVLYVARRAGIDPDPDLEAGRNDAGPFGDEYLLAGGRRGPFLITYRVGPRPPGDARTIRP